MPKMEARKHSAYEMVKILQRGIAGHLTLISAAAGWGTSSELTLYPVIGTIFNARGWKAKCQWDALDKEYPKGAPRSIDFVAQPFAETKPALALEVKLIASNSPGQSLKTERDICKLKEFKIKNLGACAYLLIVGRKVDLEKKHILVGQQCVLLRERPAIVADVGKTAWGSVAIRM